ncbi:MAG: PDZ domain-containing protein [Armatimonadota bacterium]|nr:PDZ domain-containing protein [Armatimonadota bacterium]
MKLCLVLFLCLAVAAPPVCAEVAAPPQPVPVQTALPVPILEYEATPLPLAAAPKPPPGYMGMVLGTNLVKPGEPAAGVMVEDVVAGSPAAAAGALVGDVVTAVDAAPVNTPTDLVNLIRAMPIGQKVTLHILRKGHPLIFSVTLGAPPAALLNKVNTFVPIGNYVVIADTGAIVEEHATEINLLPGALVPSRSDIPIRVAVPLPAQPIGSMPGDQPIVPVEAHGRPAYLSGLVLDSTDSPASNVTVTAYAAEGNGIAAVTTTLVNGAYVLRLPGPGSYRVEVAAGGSARQQMVEVPAAGLQGIKLTLAVRLRIQRLGYLGLILGQPTPAAMPRMGGVTVEDVAVGSAGAAAGIQAGDSITTLNGIVVTDPAKFSTAIQSMKPGRKVVIGVVRKGQKLEISVVLGALRLPPLDLAQPIPVLELREELTDRVEREHNARLEDERDKRLKERAITY